MKNVTHNLTFEHKSPILTGKMEKEAGDIFKEALEMVQNETARKETEREAEKKFFQERIQKSIETYKQFIFPVLKRRVNEFEKDPNAKLVLNLARGYAHKIEQNEKIKKSDGLVIKHSFWLPSEKDFQYLPLELIENPEPRIWPVETIKKVMCLEKGAEDLIMRASINYSAEPEVYPPEEFRFYLSYSDKDVHLGEGFYNPDVPNHLAPTRTEDLSRAFALAFINKRYYFVSPMYEDWGGGAR